MFSAWNSLPVCCGVPAPTAWAGCGARHGPAAATAGWWGICHFCCCHQGQKHSPCESRQIFSNILVQELYLCLLNRHKTSDSQTDVFQHIFFDIKLHLIIADSIAAFPGRTTTTKKPFSLFFLLPKKTKKNPQPGSILSHLQNIVTHWECPVSFECPEVRDCHNTSTTVSASARAEGKVCSG